MARRSPKRIGLAIIGAGRVGLFRGEVAARHPAVDWIGVADLKADRAKLVGDKCKAELVTSDYRELLATLAEHQGLTPHVHPGYRNIGRR